MAEGAKGQLVLVTGATGYIAGHLVKQLLERGYRVRGTCRSASSDRASVLRSLEGASDRLELVEADLLTPGAFDEAVKGCVGVFHTASPFHYKAERAEELIEPAVKGTQSVLESAAKEPSVRRVVLTSSFAAVLMSSANPEHAKPYTEEHWNDFSTKDSPDVGNWYRASKVEAEKAAWKIVEREDVNFDLATINPPLVIGDWLPGYKTLNTSSNIIFEHINGSKDEANPGRLPFVDVLDVARAHIEAFEQPQGTGRFLVSAKTLSFLEAAQIAAEIFPELKDRIPKTAKEGGLDASIDASKVTKVLGIEPRDIRDTIKDQVQAFIREGLLKL